MLLDGKNSDEIANCLYEIETVTMGFTANPMIKKHTKIIADRLLNVLTKLNK